MDLHEWQSKELLAAQGVAIPRGGLPANALEAAALAESLGGRVVVKAQIHAGGRGKAGGVRLAESPAEASTWFDRMLGMTLVTPQTGPRGEPVRAVYLSQAVDIARELYVSLLVDRAIARVAILASSEGGVEIEKVAAETPGKLFRLAVDPATGIGFHHAREVAAFLGLHGDEFRQFQAFLLGIYDLFIKKDCALLEINPLVVTGSGGLLALDAKIVLDDNALARHPDLEAFRDPQDACPEEAEAARYGLNFIKLEGSIGCLVNGAGLAMATMDLIKLCGGEPANFLDLGGAVSEEAVTHAFGIILRDSTVKAVLVNIFGGIVRCDLVACGLIQAVRGTGLKVPVVVRLEGTNADQGRQLLEESGMDFRLAGSLDSAARAVLASMG